MLFVNYPKCTTCVKARKFLESTGHGFDNRDIKTHNPTVQELQTWYQQSGLPLKKFFNTSGNVYKELQLKDKLADMSEEAQLNLLATDGMLVKRPLLITDKGVAVGYNEATWSALLP